MTEPWLKLKGYIGVAGVRTRGLSRRDVVLIASKLFGVEGSPAEVAVAIDAMGRDGRRERVTNRRGLIDQSLIGVPDKLGGYRSVAR